MKKGGHDEKIKKLQTGLDGKGSGAGDISIHRQVRRSQSVQASQRCLGQNDETGFSHERCRFLKKAK